MRSRPTKSTSVRRIGWARGVLVAVVLSVVAGGGPAAAAPQDDAGSRSDAGDTFQDATPLKPRGFYEGRLDPDGGDAHDYYRFTLREGESVSVLVTSSAGTTDPLELLDPNGNVVDAGASVAGVSAAASTAFTTEYSSVRLAVHRAVTAGQYRLHLQSDRHVLHEYALCFMNCDKPHSGPIQLIFEGSLQSTDTQVLLVPPSHGDLGNPLGPTVADYLDATLRGMHGWTEAIDAFTKDFPRFSYLREIEVEVEVFDGVTPVDPAGYDVIVGYVAAGPVFRGVATDTQTRDDVKAVLDQVGLADAARWGGRVIALSLFGSSPRAGQVTWDFPEVNDLESVTLHEFGHTFGVGHTHTWHPKLGPDLMNSPYPFVYGDGFALGDGGERTKLDCISSLDLYALATLYQWVPRGEWQFYSGALSLPREIPYRLYC